MISRRRIRWLLASVLASVVILGFALWTAPRWLVPRIAAASPGCLDAVRTTERAVAFTFDDGPDAGHTDEIPSPLRVEQPLEQPPEGEQPLVEKSAEQEPESL